MPRMEFRIHPGGNRPSELVHYSNDPCTSQKSCADWCNPFLRMWLAREGIEWFVPARPFTITTIDGCTTVVEYYHDSELYARLRAAGELPEEHANQVTLLAMHYLEVDDFFNRRYRRRYRR